MILRTGVIALLFTLCLSGCATTKPVVWKAQDVSFADLKTFYIQPVFNATGSPVKPEILSFLTANLKEQFEMRDMQLTDDPQTKSGVMIVRSELLVFVFRNILSTTTSAGPRNRIAHCTLRTRLVDKSTSHVVAKILTVKEAGGKMSSGVDSGKWTLKESAAAVAEEVAKMMRDKQGPYPR